MKKLLLIACLLFSVIGFTQSKRIKIIRADNTHVDPRYPNATISFGNVFVEHEGATLRCDKAYIYQEKRLIKAMGNVILNQGDTIFQYSKYVDYDAHKKFATSWGNVVLKDPVMTLKTDTLYFDRIAQNLYYNHKGTIKDTTNFLKSKTGIYNLTTNDFKATINVEVLNDESLLESDNLDYNTDTGIAKLFGPSTITSSENIIYTERGYHNSKTNISHLLKNSKIYSENRTIEGDSLYYDKTIEFASGTGHIKILDTLNNSIIKGGYAEFFNQKDSVFITEKAVAISVMEKDSLFIHGDTLMVIGKEDNRIIKAFHKVKYFKSNLQGKCDSLVSYELEGLTKLFYDPIMWAQGNQITGDTLHLITNVQTEQLDSIKILGNGFLIQKDTAGYNQLKGKNMYGTFEDNNLKTLDAVGNSEVVFYIRDELQKLIGIFKMASSRNIFITLENSELESITYIKKPEGKTFPPSKLPDDDKLLEGFIWRDEERPLSKDDIFVHKSAGIQENEESTKIENSEGIKD